MTQPRTENETMQLQMYQVDAFTQQRFHGNPAAVVPLQSWLDDTVLQAIAAENNLAETAFTVPASSGWELRWFTPSSEVDLCGHATLAAAHVHLAHLHFAGTELHFHTRKAGTLTVSKAGDNALSMSFPAISVDRVDDMAIPVAQALGAQPARVLEGYYSAQQKDYVAVFEHQDAVAALRPAFSAFAQLDSRGVIATAPGADSDCDFVSRYFAPVFGIDEDPVTGSAHCLLAPYWAGRLDKQALNAKQVSARCGDIHCNVIEDRVVLTGHVADYLVGTISI